MAGLRSINKQEFGLLVKPWKLMSNKFERLLPMKNKFSCRGHSWSERHAPCAGKNTKYSEGYTEEFCRMVHVCFFEYIKKVAARNRCEPVPTPRIGNYDDDY